MADCGFSDSNETDVERLERRITERETELVKMKEYLNFLKANPLLVEYDRLRRAAGCQ